VDQKEEIITIADAKIFLLWGKELNLPALVPRTNLLELLEVLLTSPLCTPHAAFSSAVQRFTAHWHESVRRVLTVHFMGLQHVLPYLPAPFALQKLAKVGILVEFFLLSNSLLKFAIRLANTKVVELAVEFILKLASAFRARNRRQHLLAITPNIRCGEQATNCPRFPLRVEWDVGSPLLRCRGCPALWFVAFLRFSRYRSVGSAAFRASSLVILEVIRGSTSLLADLFGVGAVCELVFAANG
jgi:hypothetical protein